MIDTRGSLARARLPFGYIIKTMKYLKNVSNRFSVAVTTKKGIVNLGKGEKIDFAELVNMAEVNSLLTRIPAIVTVGEDKPVEAPKAVERVDVPVTEEKAVESPVEAQNEAPETVNPAYVKVEPVKRQFGKKKNRR